MKLNKAQRMMVLYQKLSNGETVCKSTFCIEYGIEDWTFDRYITDIRNLLRETFSLLEVVYDRNTRGYRIENPAVRREMGLGECFILAKLLLDSRTLRTDDQSAIVEILLSQLRPEMRERARPILLHTPELPDCFTKASVKLVEDLLYSIECNDRITLHFGVEGREIECIPYSVEFHARTAWLAAWELASDRAVLYPLNDIQSYIPARKPYPLSFRELEALQLLVTKLCNEEFSSYQPYIYQEGDEKNA